MKWMIAIFVTVFVCSNARAEVYEWVDGQGVVHFSDDPDKVPDRYRKRVKIRDSVSPEGGVPAVRHQAPPPSAPPEKKAELYGGRGENWWRGRFQALRDEMKTIQEKLPEKKESLAQLHRKWVISMGRSPKAGETGESRFFKTPKEGSKEVKSDDKFASTTFGAVGRNRAAYYAMKDEIEKDEARITDIEGELASVDAEATKAGVPFGWRK